MSTFEELSAELDEHLAAGEVMKPVFDELKRKLDRLVDKEDEVISKNHKWGTGSTLDAVPGMNGLHWAYTSNLHEVGALKNKLAKSTAVTHQLYKDTEAHYKRWLPLHDKMKALKAMIVTVTAKRAQVKVAKEAEFKIKYQDASSLVKVLTEHRDEFINEAKKRAHTYYSEVDARLKAVDYDVDKLESRPTHGMRSLQHRLKNARRSFLTEVKTKGVTKLVDEAGQSAADDYDAFVNKLITKIGKPVDTANMTGDPWHGSVLHVVCHDGEKQSWHTQMILNQSKYARLFNQFPTRRL